MCITIQVAKIINFMMSNEILEMKKIYSISKFFHVFWEKRVILHSVLIYTPININGK